MPKRTVAAVSITAVLISILFAVSSFATAQQECPSPQLIEEVTGNGNQETAPFTTSTNLLRISYNAQATRETVPVIVHVRDADDPEQRIVGDASTQGPGSGEAFINVPPGRYFLDISTTDAQYTIKIESCGESAKASPSEGTNVQGSTQSKSAQPKSMTAPIQPAPPAQPKATPPPQPVPQPPPSPGPLLNAGGPKDGPVPRMPDGGCPVEFPQSRSGVCHRS